MFTTKYQRIVSATLQEMRAKAVLYAQKFEGFPAEKNFKLVEEELPPISDGQFLVQAEFVSVDPYMRTFTRSADLGKPMMGEQVAKIIQSKNPKYPVGEYVLGEWGWRSHTVATDTPGSFFNQPPKILKNFDKFPKSLALGVLGMTGNTAYWALLSVCNPEKGNTVVVSAAGGAVGSHVGQIAKIKGCTVVGITGSDEKGRRLIDELNFDAFVNYKSPDFAQKLEEATPNRVDCYFDNVGGEISSAVLNRLNKFARIVICGAISTYNEASVKAAEVQTPIKIYHARMEGFSVNRFQKQWDESFQQNLKWIKEANLKYPETVIEGFENIPRAFIGLFKGENFGKTVVKV